MVAVTGWKNLMRNLKTGLPGGLIAFAMLSAVMLAQAPQAVAETMFETSELTIVTASGRHKLRVEIARTPATRRQGLMFRPEMALDAGMLFDYGRERPVAMWMKNTLIALDMLFISADGGIVNIAENTVPGSLETISSSGPVLAVLELNGGTVARLNIRPGDRIEHEIFTRRSGESTR